MNHFIQIVKSDFKNYLRYSVLQTVLVLSILFSVSMAFFPQINPLILVYITVFILPVVILSISVYIETEEESLFPLAVCECSSIEIIFAKLCSALLMLLIPLILYIIVMFTVLHMNYNIFLFILIYLLSATIHIIIGFVLAITSKSSNLMSISYIGYIVIFSVMPIFYQQGLIPEFFQYALIISPAYLSGILFETVIVGYIHTPNWLIVLAVLLQFVYIFVFTFFVIRPYFKSYLLFRIDQKGEQQEK
ncbi:MAG: ABC transporter permease [Tenericutes bacterium]|nr:ABC transporter permease [Mycoplasmatota bacterium]